MTLLKDLRALGSSAVPRAAYELSKRTGAHRFIFNTVRKESSVRTAGTYFTPAIDSWAAQLCLADAQKIVSDGLVAFGQRFPVVTSHDWNTDPETGDLWPQAAWWTIDIRTDRRLGDVKWTWELGRHRDLVVLARAAALDPDGEWIGHLNRLMTWWCEANPLESSIHWYSNLELALRLFAWDQVLGLAAGKLEPRTLNLMSMHITQMRRHLWRDLPYTLSSMRNNHMLGDALGLWLADALTGHAGSAAGARVAERIWQVQLARQVYPDGSMIEDSVSYHRFALEMLCARYLTGDRSPQLRSAITVASRYLADLGALNGPIPQYGDWDEGRVLASSSDPLDVGNSVALGLAISGNGVDPAWFDKYDLLTWYFPKARAAGRPPTVRPTGRFGEIATARRGPWQVWLKCGSRPSHGHADLGHVSARYREQWIVVDPGTGTYNGPLDVRNGFRTSQAHNVLRPLGEGQIEPHRAFRWMSVPNGVSGRVHELPSGTVLWGAHDAYVTMTPSPWPWRIVRACVVAESGIAVIDWREGGPGEYELNVQFDPACVVAGDSVMVGAESLALHVPGESRIAMGEQKPFLGWISRTYGSWEPAPWLVTAGSSLDALVWTLGDLDHEVSNEGVQVAGIHLRVNWSSLAVTLELAEGEQLVTDTVHVERTP